MSKEDIGLPTSLINTGRVLESFSDCICLWSHWTQDEVILFPVLGSVCPEITPSRIIPLEHSLDPCLWMPELHLEGFMR